MLDKSIPYVDVLMKRESGSPLPRPVLPSPYSFVTFSDGDELQWAEIETSVGEFDQTSDALSHFEREFLPHKNELKRRCMFVTSDGERKVGTCTAWWNYTHGRRDPWLYWVAVRPEYQGFGLGKAVVFECMRRLVTIEGDRTTYLHTQTWSYKAINIYREAGFAITREKGLGGYKNRGYRRALRLLEDRMRR